ncbi:DUF7824 domain-containing protein [Streptomyces tsukubensis]|uniref:DUF7824 domain-containing protein n=2 Tax=Streptomyces TaxID=1883 RepID=A0A7G3UK90_STRT9|nr:DUF6493 family protein [Streptomyces tsukubensis]AZK93019.1 hypothetical protein B7R87_03335 [Streptomyces tsukubensis]QKM70817.1 hypothetical protein STSU_030495 [Streptomyces tsukubensis NRRL18488]TAI41064.1 hypothetical protein EWI31_29350 [Streptomyces tsukubensis]
MTELMQAVRKGWSDKVPGLLEPLGPAERKEVLAELKKLRKELRDWDWREWGKRVSVARAVLVAGAGCLPGPAAAAAWIGARELQLGQSGPPKLLMSVLEHRDDDFLGKLAHRLAARSGLTDSDALLIDALVQRSGCPLPTADGFVNGWVELVTRQGDKAVRRLWADPRASVLAVRIFETPRIPPQVFRYPHHDPKGPWAAGLAALPEHGVVERSVLLDACVARLLRGGRPRESAFALAVLRALAPDGEECRSRVPDWLGLVADGVPSVAGHAQKLLTELAGQGQLSEESLVSMAEAVLFRPEKALVRSQLVLVDRELRKRPEAAAALLPVVGEAFGHADTDVQERAVKLVARHLAAAGDGVREELAAAAERLSPSQRTAARFLFGDDENEASAEAYEEFLPAPAVAQPLAPAPGSVAELVEELVVIMRSGEQTVNFERVFDGMVRLGAQDPRVLGKAVREAMPTFWWVDGSPGVLSSPRRLEGYFGRSTPDIAYLAVALAMDPVVPDLLVDRSKPKGSCPHKALEAVLTARLREAGHRVWTDPMPFLLATPTRTTGALDPLVLVERLREYGRLGARPGPADFGQALLRVPRGGAEAAAEAAAGLGTPEGDRLAAWLRGEGPRLPGLVPRSRGRRKDREAEEPAGEGQQVAPRGRFGNVREQLAVRREFPRAFHWLGRDMELGKSCGTWSRWQPYWAFVLPYEREVLADWLHDPMVKGVEWESRDVAAALPVLAEAEGAHGHAGHDGPAGHRLHRVVGVGMGSAVADDRLAAVDALLMLAARGQLDHRVLGLELADLVNHGVVMPTRIADALHTAASGGAYATVWSVIGPALPGLIRSVPVNRGLGRILAIAAECAERSLPAGVGEIPGLAELAARKGTSQAVVQAGRLRRALSAAPGSTDTPPGGTTH